MDLYWLKRIRLWSVRNELGRNEGAKKKCYECEGHACTVILVLGNGCRGRQLDWTFEFVVCDVGGEDWCYIRCPLVVGWFCVCKLFFENSGGVRKRCKKV